MTQSLGRLGGRRRQVARRSAPCWRPPAARCWWSACAASGAAGGRRRGRRGRASASSSPTWRRSCSTRCSTSSRRCRPGKTRSTCSTSPGAAGVDVGQVYEMDASRRTTAANAYVTGLGRTKRVVLYDTLLNDFTPGETRLVVAHELGHVHYRDVPHGLLYLAIVAPFGMFAVARLGERMAPREAPPAAAVPAVAARDRADGAGDHHHLQPALARRSSAARTRSRSSSRTSRRRSSASSAGSRSRTSPTRTRRRWRSSCSAPTPRRWSGSAWRGASSGGPAGAAALSGRFLMPSRGAPLGPVVLHGVDQLAHERGERFTRDDDDAGHLAVLDLVVDARERDRELVVGVRDVREVRVDARHRLRARCGG